MTPKTKENIMKPTLFLSMALALGLAALSGCGGTNCSGTDVFCSDGGTTCPGVTQVYKVVPGSYTNAGLMNVNDGCMIGISNSTMLGMRMFANKTSNGTITISGAAGNPIPLADNISV